MLQPIMRITRWRQMHCRSTQDARLALAHLCLPKVVLVLGNDLVERSCNAKCSVAIPMSGSLEKSVSAVCDLARSPSTIAFRHPDNCQSCVLLAKTVDQPRSETMRTESCFGGMITKDIGRHSHRAAGGTARVISCKKSSGPRARFTARPRSSSATTEFQFARFIPAYPEDSVIRSGTAGWQYRDWAGIVYPGHPRTLVQSCSLTLSG